MMSFIVTTDRAEARTDGVDRFEDGIIKKFLLLALNFSMKFEVRLSAESKKKEREE